MARAKVIGGKRLDFALGSIAKKITSGGTLRVGFLEGSIDPEGIPNAQKAFWNEFGTIRDPSRPFFRTTIREQSPQWGVKLGQAIVAMNFDGTKALGLLGQSMRDDIESSIAQWDSPGNAESTIARKGFDKPLVEKGDMQHAVDYKVGT